MEGTKPDLKSQKKRADLAGHAPQIPAETRQSKAVLGPEAIAAVLDGRRPQIPTNADATSSNLTGLPFPNSFMALTDIRVGGTEKEMKHETTRRSFIRNSAIAGGAVVAGGALGVDVSSDMAAGTKSGGGKKVYRNYTQRELDRVYDQDYWVSYSSSEVYGFYEIFSERVHREHKSTSHSYGKGKVESLDWFPCGKPNRPIQIFAHGGAWLGLTKEEAAFGAPGFLDNDVNYVALGFSSVNPPKVTLEKMVDQVARAVAWVYQNADRLGGDRDRIYLSGHSSGGQLAASALIADWGALGVPANTVKGCLLISGMYDLYPVSLCYRQGYVKLTKAEVEKLSAIRHVDRIPCPVIVAFAENDTPEFRRQGEAFAKALKRGSHHPVRQMEAIGLNHYDISFTLGYEDAIMGNAALQQMGLAKPFEEEGPAGPIRY